MLAGPLPRCIQPEPDLAFAVREGALSWSRSSPRISAAARPMGDSIFDPNALYHPGKKNDWLDSANWFQKDTRPTNFFLRDPSSFSIYRFFLGAGLHFFRDRDNQTTLHNTRLYCMVSPFAFSFYVDKPYGKAARAEVGRSSPTCLRYSFAGDSSCYLVSQVKLSGCFCLRNFATLLIRLPNLCSKKLIISRIRLVIGCRIIKIAVAGLRAKAASHKCAYSPEKIY